MKKRDLERRLALLGWMLLRNGAEHDIWTDGKDEEIIPRHTEINEYLAKKILKTAKAGESIKYENRRKSLEKQN